jgi:predicted nucleic acid-binding protein
MKFIDANVALESLLGRAKCGASDRVLADGDVCISPLSAHLIVHFSSKEGIARETALGYIKHFSITEMNQKTTNWAVTYAGADFEDALQVGSALAAGCDKFVTFDKKLARDYAKYIDMQLL